MTTDDTDDTDEHVTYLSVRLRIDLVPAIIWQLKKNPDTKDLAKDLQRAYDSVENDTFRLVRVLTDDSTAPVAVGSYDEMGSELIRFTNANPDKKYRVEKVEDDD